MYKKNKKFEIFELSGMMQSLILSNFVKAMQKLLGFRKAFIMPYKSSVISFLFSALSRK